jgi:hypothetical protein
MARIDTWILYRVKRGWKWRRHAEDGRIVERSVAIFPGKTEVLADARENGWNGQPTIWHENIDDQAG